MPIQSKTNRTGLLAIRADYDERLPRQENGNIPSSPDTYTWDYVLQPYLKSAQILVCPSDTSAGVNMTENAYGALGYGTSAKRSYAYPEYLYDEPTNGRGQDGENFNIGLFTVTDTPYYELIEAARSTNHQIYQWHSNSTAK